MLKLGDANWMLPAWLDRLLPHLRVEGGERAPVTPPSDAVEAGLPEPSAG
jgi:RND superfamily putative drug exporter